MGLRKIISGGQSGVDRGALDAALENGFPCGGSCPPGRAAEDGAIPAYYPLVELNRGSYRERTLRNVIDSDATLVIYFGELEGGTEQTVLHCIRRRKPYKLIDAQEIPVSRAAMLVREFVSEHCAEILNVAGPRASKVPAALSGSAAEVAAVGSYPATEKLSVFGKLGIYRGEAKARLDLLDVGEFSGRERTTDLTYGIGIRFDARPNIGIVGGWQRYADLGDLTDIDTLSVGLQFRF